MKKLILGIIIAIIIILGIGSYIFINHRTTSSSPESSTTSSISSSSDTKTTKTSIPTNTPKTTTNISNTTSEQVKSNTQSNTTSEQVKSNTQSNTTSEQVKNNTQSNTTSNSSKSNNVNITKSNSSLNTQNIINEYNLVGTWKITDISAYPLNTNGQDTNLIGEKIIIEPNLFRLGTLVINDPIYSVSVENLEGEFGNPGDKGYITQNNGTLNFLVVKSKNNPKVNCEDSIIFNDNRIQVLNSTSYVYNAKRI